MANIRKNLLLNSIYQLLVVLTPLITAPYISRVLRPEGVGVYSFNYTVANYFLVLAMLGVSNYGNRSIAKIRDDYEVRSKTFSEIYALQVTFALLVVVAYCLYAFSLSGENRIYALTQTLLVLSATLDVTWLFFGLELFQVTTFRSVVVKLLTVGSILLFVKNSSDVWIYCIIMAGGTLANQLLLWPFVFRYIHFVPPTFRKVISHLRPNLMLFLPVIATTLYGYVDSFMIKIFSTYQDLGFYSSAGKITSIPLSLITAIGTVMLPRMSYLAASGDKNMERRLNRNSMMLSVFLSSAFAFGILGISDVFVPLFFGPGYEYVVVLLKVLAPTMIFISWANIVRNQYLLPHNKENLYTISVFLGAILNVVLNIFLIPHFGSLGASVSTLMAEVTVTVAQTYFSRKHMDISIYLTEGAPFIVLGITMYFLIAQVHLESNIESLLLRIIIGGLYYLAGSSLYLLILKKIHKKTS